jgi:hypothetical protein
MSAMVVKDRENPDELPNAVIAYPGCDFEVIVVNEIAVAFRHGKVHKQMKLPKEIHVPFEYWDKMGECEELSPRDFNGALVDHLVVALRKVTNGPQVVEKASHFTDVIVKAIEELDELANRNFKKIDSLKDKIHGVKERLFSRLMSKDMRRG